MIKERVERRLEKSGRITPREVLDAYEQTGLKPARGVYLQDDTACALTAVVVATSGRTFTDDDGADMAIDELITARVGDTGISSQYVTSFMAGFDGSSKPGWDRAGGWRDGQRVRRFCFPPDGSRGESK